MTQLDQLMKTATKAVDSANVLIMLLDVRVTGVKQDTGGFIYKINVWNVLVVSMELLHLSVMM